MGSESAAIESPLTSPAMALEVEEENGTKVTLFVSRAILQQMPYFSARFSSRWNEEEQRTMNLKLPPGCAVEAAAVLFERLYFRRSELRALGLKLALQVVQLATMFLAEQDVFLKELQQLVLESMRARNDIDGFKEFCAKYEIPNCLRETAASLEFAEGGTIGVAQQAELLRDALISDESAGLELLERIRSKCHSSGAEAVSASAKLFGDLLRRGCAQSKETTQRCGHLTYVRALNRGNFEEHPNLGFSKVMSLISRFVFAFPEHFSLLVPLMFPKTLMQRYGFASMSPSVQNIWMPVVKNLFDQCFTEDLWELEAVDFETLFTSLYKSGYWKLLTVGPARTSFLKLCKRAPVKVKEAACNLLLLKLDVDVAAEIASSDFLRDLPSQPRYRLCTALVSKMSVLTSELKKVVLETLHDGMGLSSEGDSFQFKPKKRRTS